MRNTTVIHAVIAVLVSTVSLIGHAETRTFALVVGNNTPPADLAPLRYADDDAIRFYRFFSHLTTEARLFTVADAETQARFPKVTSQAELPTMSNLKKAARALGRKIEAARRAGFKTAVYIFFSGHGSFTENGEPSIVLSDEPMTQAVLYRDILEALNADFQHLFVDACYAEGVVGARGIFDREVDGQPVSVTAADKRVLAGPWAKRFPGLGVVVSSSADKESHEWSKIESGVFTHELLSGLSGAADVNRDGKVVYSELYAFIASANRGVSDTRSKLDVIMRPPSRNQNAPIVDLAVLRDISFLFGDPSTLQHFAVELENGERYLDANLSAMNYAHIALPGSGTAYLRTRDTEAEIKLEAGKRYQFDDLLFEPLEARAKGSIGAALAKGLFTTSYSIDYYQGVIDVSNIVSVSFEAPPLVLETEQNVFFDRTTRTRSAFAISAFSLAGVAAVSTAVFAGLSISAKKDFEDTELQRSAEDANQRYVNFGTATWISAAFIPVGVIVGLILRRRNSHNKNQRDIGLRLYPLSDAMLLDIRF